MERAEIGAWAAAACLDQTLDGFTFDLRFGEKSLCVDLHKGGRAIRRDMPWEQLDQAVHPRSIVESQIQTAAKFVEAALATEPTVN